MPRSVNDRAMAAADPDPSAPAAATLPPLTAAGFDRGVRVADPVEVRLAFAAAAMLGRPVLVVAAPGLGVQAGAGWWRAVLDPARAAEPTAEVTAVLDCGERPGAVLAALRAGIGELLIDPAAEPLPAAAVARLAGIAGATGARLWCPPLPPLIDPGAGRGRDPVAALGARLMAPAGETGG
jgi:hypothetical protein